MAKMAAGSVTTCYCVYLSATCPVVVSPAMDEDIWHHPATKIIYKCCSHFGNSIINVEHGELASGLVGEGRMAEPESIVNYVTAHFFRDKVLRDKKVLVTAGPIQGHRSCAFYR